MSDNSNEIIYSIENVSEVQTFLKNLVPGNNLTGNRSNFENIYCFNK